jgi:HAD superfamily hydrolase (TIGR01509 family)
VAIRAIGFDIGGVLERIAPVDVWLGPWRERLGMGESRFRSMLGSVDPDGIIETGGLTEAEYGRRYAEALGLSSAQAAEFMADLWHWYCGELDQELVGYVAGLRPRYLTAILSNSADGARREEQARHSLPGLFDVIIYSHEAGLAKPDPRAYALLCAELNVAPDELVLVDDAPANVEAARQLGIHGLLHQSAPATISEITCLLASCPPPRPRDRAT